MERDYNLDTQGSATDRAFLASFRWSATLSKGSLSDGTERHHQSASAMFSTGIPVVDAAASRILSTHLAQRKIRYGSEIADTDHVKH